MSPYTSLSVIHWGNSSVPDGNQFRVYFADEDNRMAQIMKSGASGEAKSEWTQQTSSEVTVYPGASISTAVDELLLPVTIHTYIVAKDEEYLNEHTWIGGVSKSG